jgi:hypothetical protein
MGDLDLVDIAFVVTALSRARSGQTPEPVQGEAPAGEHQQRGAARDGAADLPRLPSARPSSRYEGNAPREIRTPTVQAVTPAVRLRRDGDEIGPQASEGAGRRRDAQATLPRLGYPNFMPRLDEGFRARLDRSTRRALLLGGVVLAVAVLVELVRAA